MSSPGDDPPEFGINGDYDEEAALAAAIAMSLEQPGQSPPVATKVPEEHETPTPLPTQPNSFGPMGLDRKQMEAERLARQRKRNAAEAGLDVSVQHRPAPPAPSSLSSSHASAVANTDRTGSLPFSKGVVKRTWALGHPRTEQDIKIEDILMRDELELAVLSSFQWDETWLLSKVDISRTKLILIAFANDKAQQREMQENVPSRQIRFCFPPMSGGGYLHSKIQLLKFKRHLRIVVPSGNLVPYDWGETGQLENMVFIIDLPLLEPVSSASGAGKGTPTTSFGTELRRFLRAQGLEEGLILSLDKYDFTETQRYGFVHSISGSHTDDSSKETGYCGLGSVVRKLGLDSLQPVDIHYITSSVGSLDEKFLTAIYNACQGDSGMKEYQDRQDRSKMSRSKKAGSGKGQGNSATEAAPLEDHFRIFFPSDSTVARSKGGRAAGGTICFQERWWKSPTFPHKLLRDAVNVRKGVLMHSKMLFVRPASRDVAGPAWAYVGSANLSESAWGRLVKDRATGLPKMSCRNWECGVLVPVATSQQPGPGAVVNDSGLGIFKGKVPVPTELPGEAFSEATIHSTQPQRQPWFFQAR